MRPYNLVIADDHVMFRQGLKKIINANPAYKIVGEASNGLELLNLLKQTVPDLILLDISMPKLQGLEAAKEIKKRFPKMKILILTMHKSNEYLNYALSIGADGYLLKEDADSELFSAIDTVRQQGIYISPLLSPQLKDLLLRKYREDRTHMPEDPLTKREKEILRHIAEGKSSREIGALLEISSRTVEHHRANMMRKLGCRKIAELVRYAIQKGYTSDQIFPVVS
jgi:DNA-binding NarL/FixJ family response regulator